MQVTFIACPFKTSYGAASESLKRALEKKPDDRSNGWHPTAGAAMTSKSAGSFRCRGASIST